LLGFLAGWYPFEVDPDDDLGRELAFLGLAPSAETVDRAARGLAVLGGVVAIGAALVVPPGIAVVASLLPLAAGLVAAWAVLTAPRLFATARRTSALGDAPDLVARTVLRMRIDPSPESAAEFAADSDDGPLATSLRHHVLRARWSPNAGLEGFAAEWAAWFPALRRSLSLVEAAGSAAGDDRDRLLDRAMDAVLEGTETSMRSFAAEIRGPVTALYAFGVLLPTALVSLLPAASMAGLPVTPLSVGLVYDLLLPLALLGGSAWLLARRPVAFRPPDVDAVAARGSGRARLAVATGLVAATAGSLGTSLTFPWWAPPLAAVGYGCGLGLLVLNGPVLSVYEHVDAVEAGLSDALTLVGRRVAGGQAAEAAIAETAAELDGAIADVFATVARQQRQLSASLDGAFAGRYGAASGIPSPRLRRSVDLLGRAATEGQPAGDALLALGDHLAALRSVEERARQDLERVCGTLASTGRVFGPLVAGATVALADGMAGDAAFVPGGGEPLPWLGLAVGAYALLMAGILSTLAVGLRRGLDGPLVGYHVGRALVLATTSLLVAYALASTVA
jgi:Flp pilus assembly protein TadB